MRTGNPLSLVLPHHTTHVTLRPNPIASFPGLSPQIHVASLEVYDI